eukprot:jgi/Chlat1/6893/Chrsp52S06577
MRACSALQAASNSCLRLARATVLGNLQAVASDSDAALRLGRLEVRQFCASVALEAEESKLEEGGKGKRLGPWAEKEQLVLDAFWRNFGTVTPYQVSKMVLLGQQNGIFRDVGRLQQRMLQLQSVFPNADVIKMVKRQPRLMCANPESLKFKAAAMKDALSVSDEMLTLIVQRVPSLLHRKLDGVLDIIGYVENLLSVSTEKAREVCLRCPQLFQSDAQRMRSRFNLLCTNVALHNLGDETFARDMILNSPHILRMREELIAAKIARLVGEVRDGRQWGASTLARLVGASEAVLDRMTYCRQHQLALPPISAALRPAASWQKMYPDFEDWRKTSSTAGAKILLP